jgi:hypothetical protein
MKPLKILTFHPQGKDMLLRPVNNKKHLSTGHPDTN